jgi:Domain of unknown function (DUF4124)
MRAFSMRRYSAITAVVLAVGLAAGVRADDIWKWVDAQGIVHYSDRPVPGAVLVKGRDSASDDSSSAPGGDQKSLDTSSKQITDQLNKEEAARKVQQDEAAERAAQCKEAQDQYDKVIRARRIYTTDQSGNRTYLSDDEAEKQRVQAQLDVENYCGSSASQ